MAVSTQVIRVKNPRRRRRTTRRAPRMFRNKKGRFVKRSRGRVRNTPRRTHKINRRRVNRRRNRRVANRRHTRHSRRRTYKVKRRVRRRKTNPVLIELGAVNPRKRRTHVARRRKHRRNPRRRHVRARRVYRRRRRRNPVSRARGVPAWAKAYGYRRRNRRHNRRHNRRRHHYSRRRNPAIFGRSSGKDLMIMVGGGLVGVAATKYLPTLLPASITAGLGGGPLMSVLMTGAGAFVAGWLAGKVNKEFGEAVLFGGLMQTGSAALNAFAPPTIAGRLALSGVGDIVPTGPFTVPNNQFKTLAMPAPNGMSGFRTAFGRR